MKRGIVKDVICKIGVGKESDIYKCLAFDGTPVVLKLTRLGRRSFKTIKNNR
jgi:RIO kinase 2